MNHTRVADYFAALDAGRFPVERGFQYDHEADFRLTVLFQMLISMAVDRGVYAAAGRQLIRCRYCRAVGTLSDDECDEAAEHPDRFVARLLEGRPSPTPPDPWG